MSLIDNKVDTFVEYFYAVSEFIILIGSEKIELPIERISGISIQHFFEEAVFPLFKFNVVLEPSRYYKILDNRDKVKIKVRIQSWYRKNGTKEESMRSDFINDTFSLFLNENNSDYQKDLKKSAKTDKDENELKYIDNKVELFLFKTDTVLGFRSEIKEVLTNVDMATTVVHLLESAGAKHVLMSPFENYTVYPELVLPPQTIEKQIRYLNNNYGFYRQGALIYFGLFHSYILNYCGGCTAWARNEWKETVIYVLSQVDTKSSLDGAVIKKGDTKFYYCVKGEGIDISNQTVTDNAVSGTDAFMVTMNNGGNATNVSSNALTTKKSNKKVLFNNTMNQFMASTYAAQQYANSNVLTFVVDKCNILAFNPNKKFSVIFENATLNKQYKGVYRISQSMFTFSNNGCSMDVSGFIQLKKVK